MAQVGSVGHFRMVLATTSQLWDRRKFSLIHGLQSEDRSQGSSLLTMVWHTMPTEQTSLKLLKGWVQGASPQSAGG